jgi:hypothetical protein
MPNFRWNSPVPVPYTFFDLWSAISVNTSCLHISSLWSINTLTYTPQRMSLCSNAVPQIHRGVEVYAPCVFKFHNKCDYRQALKQLSLTSCSRNWHGTKETISCSPRKLNNAVPQWHWDMEVSCVFKLHNKCDYRQALRQPSLTRCPRNWHGIQETISCSPRKRNNAVPQRHWDMEVYAPCVFKLHNKCDFRQLSLTSCPRNWHGTQGTISCSPRKLNNVGNPPSLHSLALTRCWQGTHCWHQHFAASSWKPPQTISCKDYSKRSANIRHT